MTINNPEKFVAGLWDWAILDGCFGDTKIKPTDVEGEVERHGYFLRLETKAPGANIPDGQRYYLEALVNTGYFSVIVVWGNTNETEKIMTMTHREVTYYENATNENLRGLVKRWFEWANNKTPVPRFRE